MRFAFISTVQWVPWGAGELAARARAEKQITRDPVGEFCERLKARASAKSSKE